MAGLPERLWWLSRLLHRQGFPRLSRGVKFINYLVHGALLPGDAIVGENVRLEHYAMGVVIHPNVSIGSNCRIFHQVTIAGECEVGSATRVAIGSGVLIGVQALIVPRAGVGLTIGNDAIIGAGAVVTRDVPTGAIMAGSPARVIGYRASTDRL